MKKWLFVLFMFAVWPLNIAEGKNISEQIIVEAEIVTAHRAKDFGDEMYYLYRNGETLYIVIHGQEDGRVMDGISAKSAVHKILRENEKKLEEPYSKILIVCCYSNAHQDFFSREWNAQVEFLADSDKELIVHLQNTQFSFSEKG